MIAPAKPALGRRSGALTAVRNVERASALILLPFLVGMLLLDGVAMVRLSGTHDEGGHLAFGRTVVERRAVSDPMQKMAISALNYLPAHVLRVAGIGASGLGGALLSTTLYALCPNILAHSQLATNGLHAAAPMFASTLIVVRSLEAPTPSRALVCALAFGLAQVTKHTALLLPIFGLLWVGDVVHGRRWSPTGWWRSSSCSWW